ncbi:MULTISPECIES: RNA 2',3'-cyclic phosphodiesterase [Roseobacteraceae]|uniref:RNA 2',3'-cyclic phosphodiesterase n=1 Tax=Roseobacteraceae TaxID=2854170 RepID=UPI00125F3D64|nr:MULTISPECIES: RNA 2',3'-cyclic phosphodiesterase [Roseobacteraceae]KAB6717643.1 RNA 2',3'-cyclic phosphodiesterase [Roseobacter sp. TSBP12]|tara:strand:- start:2228 stop:2770 length:543 start_codon:yes stop_codon:yes gene_type:complete
MRAFVALPLPTDLTDRLEDITLGLRFGRAVRAENMHVTLAFLEDQPEAVLAELHEALAAIYAPSPQLTVTGLNLFGGDKPRLLFAAIAPDAALSDLRQKIRKAARAVGIALSHERFRPHISLRRFHRIAPSERADLDLLLAAKAAFTWPTFRPTQFEMIQSTLTSEGPVYDGLASYPLSL